MKNLRDKLTTTNFKSKVYTKGTKKHANDEPIIVTFDLNETKSIFSNVKVQGHATVNKNAYVLRFPDPNVLIETLQ